MSVDLKDPQPSKAPLWAMGFLGVIMVGAGLLYYLHQEALGMAKPGDEAAGLPAAVIASDPIVLPIGEGNGDVAAPDFKLTDVSTGKDFRLHELRGKVVLVDFWATWCGPCRGVIPSLVELQGQYGDKIQVVGISVDREGTDLKGFASQWNMNYLVGQDAEHQVTGLYGGIAGIPTIVVIGKHGQVLASYVGGYPKDHYDQIIRSALAKT